MGAFGGFTLTNKGRTLQSKAQSGVQLSYTRIAVGSGQLGGQSILLLNTLIDQKKSLPVTRLRMQPPNKAIIGAVLSNQDVTTGFYFREIGVFATDPDEGEILYCYANSGTDAEYIPVVGGADIIEKTIDCTVIIGTASNVTATINESLVLTSLETFNEHTDAAVLDHPDGSVTTAKLGAKVVTSAKLGDGSATDTVIGNRTLSDTAAPVSDTGSIPTLLSGLAYQIKSITGASWKTASSMTISAIKTILDAAVSIATPSTLIKRDSSGRAQVVAPSAAGDIAIKSTVDAAITTAATDATTKANTVQTNLNTHAATATVGVHGSASVVTVNTLMHRDASGRAQVASPSAAADIARKDTVDAVQTNLDNHKNATGGVHGATSAATINALIQRDSAGRAQVAAPLAAADIARKDTVDNAITGLSYTAADVLAKLLTVDGAGSGVDADMLEGQHGSYYTPKTVTLTSGTNLNTVVNSGFYRLTTAHANDPGAQDGQLIVSGGLDTIIQIAISYTSGNNMYVRGGTPAEVGGTGSWGAWTSIAKLASPAFTGMPTAPTAAAGTNTTQLATTAFVEAVRVILATADALKAPLASPALTGVPTAPTAALGTNTTQIATMAAIQAAIAALINAAPGALDTLDELALAMGDDANFATTMTNALALKAPLASPAFSGSPTVPTAAPATNSTQAASTQFVQTVVAAATPAKAKVSNSLVATTSAVTVTTYTAPAVGNYLVGVYLRVITATTTVTVAVTYTDAGGAQTTTIANAQAFPVGSWSLLPVFLASTATAINVVVTTATANQVYASASIVGV
ncbi:phage tail protein [Paenibacillus wynnii]|uniref:phage tail-collar fiber domain-containing protein n=1 Tax=Paenibacillus wynnii TaxID=268407 RepID=UPI00056CC1F3|nr:phage tail protein [Paenibacillus wynnii]